MTVPAQYDPSTTPPQPTPRDRSTPEGPTGAPPSDTGSEDPAPDPKSIQSVLERRVLGRSPAMRRVREEIAAVLDCASPVCITGATGSGKDVVARAIHDLGPRADGPFVATNCGALSESLLESDLFGHERGSFTGAERRRRGMFEQADGGTLFLDEITEMPADMQASLLRVLESGEARRVGGERAVQHDIRLVTASNRDLSQAVADGHLREDLLHRIFVLDVTLPPLSAREDDILLLAEHFLVALAAADGREPKTLCEAASRKLLTHRWPGNVRELHNVIERAHVLSRAAEVIPAEAIRFGPSGASADSTTEIHVGMKESEVLKRLLLGTLELCNGDKRAAAEMLGVSVKTIYNRLAALADDDETTA